MNAIILNMPDADYRKAKGFNASGAKEFVRSPAHFQARKRQPFEPTPALLVGIVFHTYLLTPDEPLRVAIRPEGFNGRTTEGKAWLKDHPDNITFEQEANCRRMVEAIRAHPDAGPAFKTGHPEVSVFREYVDPFTGSMIQLKARMDWVTFGRAIVDAKSIEDARPMGFAYTADDCDWWLQAVWYRDFMWNPVCDAIGKPEDKKTNFIFVACEKEDPWAIKCYSVAPEVFRQESIRIERILTQYAVCERDNVWPSYPPGIALASPNQWSAKRKFTDSMQLESTISHD